jgi:hypothetical protein
MKLFMRDDKINFVDENNCFVGYDMEQQCCELAGWFISDIPCKDVVEETKNEQDLEGFVFDTDFFREVRIDGLDDEKGVGTLAIFRITDGNTEKFIHLYNIHNGWYCHGFSWGKEGEL